MNDQPSTSRFVFLKEALQVVYLSISVLFSFFTSRSHGIAVCFTHQHGAQLLQLSKAVESFGGGLSELFDDKVDGVQVVEVEVDDVTSRSLQMRRRSLNQ